jgi:hypothetical protein
MITDFEIMDLKAALTCHGMEIQGIKKSTG